MSIVEELFDYYKEEADNNSIEWLIDNNRFRKIQKEELNLKEGEVKNRINKQDL